MPVRAGEYAFRDVRGPDWLRVSISWPKFTTRFWPKLYKRGSAA
jgi:hypothetical protein